METNEHNEHHEHEDGESDLEEYDDGYENEVIDLDLNSNGEEDIDEDDDDDGEPIEVEDLSSYSIDKHDGAVFCLDIFQNLILTGGEDDRAFVWMCQTKTVDDKPELTVDLLFEFNKFSDSVTSVQFSHDGKYAAASDLMGNIQVFLVESKTLFWSHELGTDIEVLKWHPSCNVLFCGSVDGQLWMFKLSTGEIKTMFSGDETTISTFHILKDGKSAVCAYNSGSVRFWDLKSGKVAFSQITAHEKEIICMDQSLDGSMIATGGVDMKINLINARTGALISYLSCTENFKTSTDEYYKKKNIESKPTVPAADAISEDESGDVIKSDSIETLGFCKILPIIACGTLSGQIITWDVQSVTVRNKLNDIGDGITKLIWSNAETMFVSCINGYIFSFDGRSLQGLQKFSGHTAEILDFCVDIDRAFLASASNDHYVKIFQIKQN